MKIDFYVRFQTISGQSLSITGNTLPLGNFDLKQALLLEWHNTEFWHGSIEVNDELNELNYQYIFTTEKGKTILEDEKLKFLSLKNIQAERITIIDFWNDTSTVENVFYTSPFQKVLLPDRANAKRVKSTNRYTHILKAKAPLLKNNECVCIAGSTGDLHNWQVQKPLLLQNEDREWEIRLNLHKADFPVEYKYGVYNIKKGEFVHFEGGENRILYPADEDNIMIQQDGFIRTQNTTWRGAGVAIPLFSLRSSNSFGAGEFPDIKLLVDWAVLTGLKLIQVLPVNDTSATFTNKDSYPYASISAFALHPIYCNLQKVAGKKWSASIRSLSKKQKQLNALDHLDYEKVIHYKISTLRELYDLQAKEVFAEKEYLHFFEDNRHWLMSYAVFCYLRDKYGTADFSEWKTHNRYDAAEVDRLCSRKSKCFKQIGFYFFVQYQLHLQLKEAAAYAHKKGIILKGDIAIGVYRHSADAWAAPHLYNMDQQAGAPPDDFAVKGQNWGFPTYNWQQMQLDGFDWWKKRFEQMSHYFDAFRIDHILGFFRIWSIPEETVEGIMGRFVPAIPVGINEFRDSGIDFDYDRFCKPYITQDVVDAVFKEKSEQVRETFLQPVKNNHFELKQDFTTQKKVEHYFEQLESTTENAILKAGLFDLISNVILFEEKDAEGAAFHFRISIEKTLSFQHLDDGTKSRLHQLYNTYFYERQDRLWEEEALRKLPHLKKATNMLVCGEDLGMVPHCVPYVMKSTGLLSLEIQRMPKNPATLFFHPNNAPYLSVITPSTHDMSTIRGWWEEDRALIQTFYNTVLESPGQAPFFCEPWINRAIVLQHLYSPAMWSIFQFQDIMGMSDDLRRENPNEERINVPADPKHYWKYRMHIQLEDLIKQKNFNSEVNDYITNSGR